MPDLYDIPYNISALDDADIFAPAVGDMLIYSGENKWRNVETGDSGQVWTAQGQGEEPGWATINTTEIANAGGRVLVDGSGGIALSPASGQATTVNGILKVDAGSPTSPFSIRRMGIYNFRLTAGHNNYEPNSGGYLDLWSPEWGAQATTLASRGNVVLKPDLSGYYPNTYKVVAHETLSVQLASGQTANGIEQRTFGDVVNFSVSPAGNLTAAAGMFSGQVSFDYQGDGGSSSNFSTMAGTQRYVWADGGNNALRFGVPANPFCFWYGANEQRMKSTAILTWGYSTPDGDAVVGVGRYANDVLEVNSGVLHELRDLKLRNLTAAAGMFTGAIAANSGGVPAKMMGFPDAPATFSGVWLTGSTPDGVNYSLVGGNNATYLNAYSNVGICVQNNEIVTINNGAVKFNQRSYLMAPSSAPLDGNISLGQVSMWHNEATSKIAFRARRSDGVYVTGEVPVS